MEWSQLDCIRLYSLYITLAHYALHKMNRLLYIHRAVGPDPAVISPTLICAGGCDSYFDREGIH